MKYIATAERRAALLGIAGRYGTRYSLQVAREQRGRRVVICYAPTKARALADAELTQLWAGFTAGRLGIAPPGLLATVAELRGRSHREAAQ